jgi:hypothetical protein
MRKIIVILVLLGLGQFFYKNYQQKILVADSNATEISTEPTKQYLPNHLMMINIM